MNKQIKEDGGVGVAAVAIEKLTSISVDLKTMLAVHEQRLSVQEQTTDNLQDTVEKRREELDIKLKDVYNTMRDQDNNILQEISKLREESANSHRDLNNRITKLEKYIWIATGGGIILAWIATNLANYLRIFH